MQTKSKIINNQSVYQSRGGER